MAGCGRSCYRGGMKKLLLILLLAVTSGTTVTAQDVPAHPYVEIVTTMGTIILELDGKQAPLTVGHFLHLVDAGFYDGTIFHRVIPGFMAQTGGHTPDLKLKEDSRSIPNESGNGLSNVHGTVAMARTRDPHSANSQFFVNVADNTRLDPGKQAGGGSWGYTVFGNVIQGMDVVDQIVNVATGPQGSFASDVPVIPIVIKKMSRYTFE
ncbi:MAG: peptidylprolyl isomerase [Proteobacteria bacterium]|nr:peptidylprolyl isomerase [Pseudomonadota bacterium]